MIPGDIIIPALTFRTAGGELDEDTTSRYADTAAGTWLDYFILSGTTTEGDTFTVQERAQVLDIWLKTTDPARLVACCWERADVDAALERGIRPMAVMRGLRDEDEAIAFFRTLPAGAFVYSHPMHTSVVLSADLVSLARHRGCLPMGAKISKIPVEEIPLVRAASAYSFTVWDGSCRHMRESYAAGATAVVATALAAVPVPFPRRDLAILQSIVDHWQIKLDRVPGQQERASWLRSAAFP